MPHQCVHCGATFGDGASEILKGCSVCGHKVFFFIRKEKLEKAQNQVHDLSKKDKKQIEKDAYDLIDEDVDKDLPVVLDFEAVSISKPGKYELDLVNLFQKEAPLVYRLEDGKYVIDLPESFEKIHARSQKNNK